MLCVRLPRATNHLSNGVLKSQTPMFAKNMNFLLFVEILVVQEIDLKL